MIFIKVYIKIMSKEFLDFFGDNKQLRLPVAQTSLGFLA